MGFLKLALVLVLREKKKTQRRQQCIIRYLFSGNMSGMEPLTLGYYGIVTDIVRMDVLQLNNKFH